jgi:hypothetical protein
MQPRPQLPLERTLAVLNSLVEGGVLRAYAIGGAMAATFYVEPVLTFDLDVFVTLPATGKLLTLTPLYQARKARGYRPKGECVEIEGVPVQFLPAGTPLLAEAMEEARSLTYGGTVGRVMRLEHLAAICLQTGRPKDRERLRMLREEAAIDRGLLAAIVKRHGLESRWAQWTA